MYRRATAVGQALILAAVGFIASCTGDGALTHEGIIECLEASGLTVSEGGRLAGEPGISVEGGSALLVVFDSNEIAEGETEDPFFSAGETDARANVFVYFAPAASDSVRTEVDSCVPSA